MQVVKNESGQYTLLFAFLFPLFLAFFAAAVNIGNLIDAKVRLQTALDRGMYAGAARLCFIMNEISGLAWEYHKLYRDLKKVFSSDSQESESEGESKLNEMQRRQEELLSDMRQLTATMYGEAHKTVYEVLAANIVSSNRWDGPFLYKICAGRPIGVDPRFLCEGMPIEFEADEPAFEIKGGQSETLYYDYMLGEFLDPNDKGRGFREVVPYVEKDGRVVAIAGMTSIGVKNPLLSQVFGEGLRIRAISAAQGFGGSIGYFGRLRGEDLGEVRRSGEGEKYQYHPSLIPVGDQILGW